MRTYWYDAAPRIGPTPEQLTIGNQRDVKLRLGRLIGGKQKGVDSLIVRDLITLGHERAITTAFLLGVDDDLREGVVETQDMGVKVILLGIQPTYEPNQSDVLIREADGHIIFDADFLMPFFAPKPVAPSISGDTPVMERVGLEEAVYDSGARFASEFVGNSTEEELKAIFTGRPVIPPSLDRDLLFYAQDTLAIRLVDELGLKKKLRAGFWRQFEGELRMRKEAAATK